MFDWAQLLSVKNIDVMLRKKCILSQVENAYMRRTSLILGLSDFFPSLDAYLKVTKCVPMLTLHTGRKVCVLLSRTFKGRLHLH